jgi:uncharacterized protein YdbL (DUF1318 family)
MMRNSILAGLAAVAAIGLVATPVLAQRDPAYAAVRSAGKVGEQADGIAQGLDPVVIGHAMTLHAVKERIQLTYQRFRGYQESQVYAQ